jgi:hypothetical protein
MSVTKTLRFAPVMDLKRGLVLASLSFYSSIVASKCSSCRLDMQITFSIISAILQMQYYKHAFHWTEWSVRLCHHFRVDNLRWPRRVIFLHWGVGKCYRFASQ